MGTGLDDLLAFVDDALRGRPQGPGLQGPEDSEPDYLAPGLRILAAPPAGLARTAVSIQAARTIAQDAMMDYVGLVNPAHMLLVKMPAGTGKSHIAAGVAGWLSNRGTRVLWAAPRHDYIFDLRGLAAKQGYDPASVYEWQPRQEGNEETGKPQTCLHTENISKWMGRGYEGIDFCSRICGWDYIKKGCAYHAQKARPEPIIMGVHQHVTLGHPMDFGVVIGDESPLGTFVKRWDIPARFIMPPDMDNSEPLAEVLHGLRALAANGTAAQGPELLRLLGGPRFVFDACSTFLMPATAARYVPHLRTADDAENAPYFHLVDLVPLLRREAEAAMQGLPYPARVLVMPDALTLLLRQEVSEEIANRRLIWLDATGDPALYETLFRRPVQVVDPFVAPRGKLIQITGRANNKRSIQVAEVKAGRAGDAGPEASAGDRIDPARYEQIKTQVAHIVRTHGLSRAGLITYKDLSMRLAADIPGLRAMHFYAARGSNGFEDVDGLIVIGTPQPGPVELDALARMVYFEDMAALDRKWTRAEVAYNYEAPDGTGRAYVVGGFWHDSRMQTVLWQQREAEILQAVHRARIINREVTVWLLANLPIAELPPTQIIDMRDIAEAPLEVDIFKWMDALRVASEAVEARGHVCTGDLTAALDIDKRTARKYIEQIGALDGWEPAAVRSPRGKPYRAAVRAQMH
jgi:hypothetical protein